MIKRKLTLLLGLPVLFISTLPAALAQGFGAITGGQVAGWTCTEQVANPLAGHPPLCAQWTQTPYLMSMGSASGYSMTLSGVNFPFSSAELSEAARAHLNRHMETVPLLPGARLRIIGHTDNTGNAAFNLQLSQQRAQAVKDYLVEKGIAAELIEAIGKGETMPLMDNGTEQGRMKNRRVELHVF